jgi:hypothetical protein
MPVLYVFYGTVSLDSNPDINRSINLLLYCSCSFSVAASNLNLRDKSIFPFVLIMPCTVSCLCQTITWQIFNNENVIVIRSIKCYRYCVPAVYNISGVPHLYHFLRNKVFKTKLNLYTLWGLLYYRIGHLNF